MDINEPRSNLFNFKPQHNKDKLSINAADVQKGRNTTSHKRLERKREFIKDT